MEGDLIRVPAVDDSVQLFKALFPRVVFAMTD
jgi:hypothetical protein